MAGRDANTSRRIFGCTPWTFILVWFWCVGLVTGSAVLLQYSYTPAPIDSSVPLLSPTLGITSNSRQAKLIVSVHPQCPCTRAMVDELRRIQRSADGGLEILVLVYVPQQESVANTWMGGSLCNDLRTVPGLVLRADPDGEVAVSLGAATSGEVRLFDSEGQLLVVGGLTPSRGHEGRSPGGEAILAALKEAPLRPVVAPVFGCPLSERKR